MTLLQTIGVAATLSACLVTASCGSDPDAKAEEPRTSASVPVPSESPASEVPLAPAEEDLTTLVTVAATSGGGPAGIVTAKAGTLWITINCRGGNLALHYQPVGELTVPCALDSVTPSKNQIVLNQNYELPFWVETGPDVRWSMRVEQGGPSGPISA